MYYIFGKRVQKCPKNFSIFGICSVFYGIFGINTENTKFLDKNWILKKNLDFFGSFCRKYTFWYFPYIGNTKNISNTVQYFWILKMFSKEISILLNIQDGQYRIFDIIEYQKKFQSRTSIILKIILNISPHSSADPFCEHSTLIC